MLSNSSSPYQRPQIAELRRRLAEPRRFIQVVAGPRQVGKTTLVQQLADELGPGVRYASADEPTLRGAEWIAQQWEAARLEAKGAGKAGVVLALDEIQKIPDWSETVKRLWDQDTKSKLPLRVVLLGSAPLLIARGMTESLAGRFELLHLPHWTFAEMRDAFGFDLDQYLYFGGYPGAAPLAEEPRRWRSYVIDSLIETSISRDVLLLTRVDKPALLRRLFEMACSYSGQILSYTKMLGQLQDAGNTTTLAHYLDLLSGAGMVRGLQKFAGGAARSRGSSPKLQVLNTALMNAMVGLSPAEARSDHEFRGRLVESAVGAHLANAAACGECELFYWRDRGAEVDFVVRAGRRVIAIEVKSTTTGRVGPGAAAFTEAFKPQRMLLVGGDGIALDDFLERPVSHWIQP
ncbi:ATP-binding protein [Engelhardtia mirabilis]|uniref:Archaeal ATPase n=1 Tax=Engelhardtia mirabilis TaxID=2528011 RepID=A0A518BDZ6_9BACT|nr:Archaeal ATPase [Planctomycetes bacterium Pla133]QDU99429.1 Archaeal ATPase [Planctomycetes bacterium Pla86]